MLLDGGNPYSQLRQTWLMTSVPVGLRGWLLPRCRATPPRTATGRWSQLAPSCLLRLVLDMVAARTHYHLVNGLHMITNGATCCPRAAICWDALHWWWSSSELQAGSGIGTCRDASEASVAAKCWTQ
jgi:hypothetical protein